MPDPQSKIEFEHIEIGEIFLRTRLVVPLNQREYSWEVKHVKELFHDFALAIADDKSSYFLGTIVLTQGPSAMPEVADGQQRLATTTILLAAIRDYLLETTEVADANSIEQEFLQRFDRDANANEPRLSLNAEDNEFFRKHVLSKPKSPERSVSPTRESHQRIKAATDCAITHVRAIVQPFAANDRRRELVRWIGFIQKTARVIMLKVPDDVNAFKMFETLNDRGLKTTQFDLVKNYLFGEVGSDRSKELHWNWSSMSGQLESLEQEDIYMTYLRHFLISQHGHTRDRDVFDKIQKTVRGRDNTVNFVARMNEDAQFYVSILSQSHNKWNDHPSKICEWIKTIHSLKVVMVRPLMLAVARSFGPEEAT